MVCPRDPNKTGSGYAKGCRCDECRATHHDRMKRQVQRRKDARVLVNGRLVTPLPVVHGSVLTYRNYGCRCVRCTDVHALKCKKYRQQRKG